MVFQRSTPQFPANIDSTRVDSKRGVVSLFQRRDVSLAMSDGVEARRGQDRGHSVQV